MSRFEESTVKEINDYLATHGFEPRDADGNDFQYGVDTDLRFKTGTVYGEVAIQVVIHGKTQEVIRILSDAQVTEVKHQIDGIIHRHQQNSSNILGGRP